MDKTSLLDLQDLLDTKQASVSHLPRNKNLQKFNKKHMNNPLMLVKGGRTFCALHGKKQRGPSISHLQVQNKDF